MHQAVRHIVVQVVYPKGFFDSLDTLGKREDNFLFLINLVVDVTVQRTRNLSELVIELRRITDATRDDKRGASLINED
ncbi:unannotated protein [freshwater metagenome]|uniref:Unannotated protein n=1 Tax=freshwater metagenome TaxID=449393 RepID=A0A6J6CQQ2_9ZZZZ